MTTESEMFAVIYVLRISVENDPRVVTRCETCVFHALTPDDAFETATAFASRLNNSYRNSDGDIVTETCLGIHELDRVEPNADDYLGTTSSLNFVASESGDPASLVRSRDALTCFGLDGHDPQLPNISQ